MSLSFGSTFTLCTFFISTSIMADYDISGESVRGIVVDLCTRTFLLLGDQNSERLVECETVTEFMNVFEVVKDNLANDQIEYTDLALTAAASPIRQGFRDCCRRFLRDLLMVACRRLDAV